MSIINLLYAKRYPITEKISVAIPTVGEVIEHEEDYYSLVTTFTAMPVDMIAQLDEAGFDFSEISDYDLFILLFNGVKDKKLNLVIEGIDAESIHPEYSDDGKTIVLKDDSGETIIDHMIYSKISSVIRKLNYIEKNYQKPGNEEAKKYMLEKAKRTAKNNKKKKSGSYLESMIVSAVNTEQFKYNYSTVLDLTIYQFNASIRQIMKKVDFDNRMIGIFAGTISSKDMKPEDLIWLADNK